MYPMTQDQTKEASSPCEALFQALNDANIPWCSWKSNEHISDGLAARTDLDLLFSPQDRTRAINLLHQSGFILFKTPAHKSYPGVIDAIAIDPATGRLWHAHCHFLLPVGRSRLKDIVLPWNNNILEGRRLLPEHPGIFTSAPAMEAVLLLVRESLKSSTGFNTELSWLKPRADVHEVLDCANNLLSPEIAALVGEIYSGSTSAENLSKLRQAIEQYAHEHGWRRMPDFMAAIIEKTRALRWIIVRILEKSNIVPYGLVRRRVLPDEGLIVAVMGADGSGKSTATRMLHHEWQHKIDTQLLYMGTGDGPVGPLQFLLKLSQRAFHALKNLKSEDRQNRHNEQIAASESKSLVLYALLGALHKRMQMRRAQSLRRKGFIVICDRWPQNHTPGMNDGPFLSHWRDDENGIRRFLARWEEKQFAHFCALQKPDITIRLLTSLETALIRKPENKKISSQIQDKIENLRKNGSVTGAENHVIDANQPLDNVMYALRNIIQSNLSARSLHPPAVIECAGLPGSGKTTLCEQVQTSHKFLSSSDIFMPPAALLEKIGFTAWSVLTNAPAYIHAALLCKHLDLWHNKESLSYIFKLPVQALRLRLARHKGRILLDQLLLQNLWSALASAGIERADPSYVAPLISRLYTTEDSVLVYLDLDAATAASRVHQRANGASRFDRLPSADISRRLTTFSGLMHDLVVAAGYAGIPVIKLDSRNTPGIIASELTDVL